MEIAGIAIWANPPPYRANSHQDLPSLVHSHSHLGRPATLMRALKGVPRATLYSVSSHSRVGSTSGAGKSYIKNIRQGLEKKYYAHQSDEFENQKILPEPVRVMHGLDISDGADFPHSFSAKTRKIYLVSCSKFSAVKEVTEAGTFPTSSQSWIIKVIKNTF